MSVMVDDRNGRAKRTGNHGSNKIFLTNALSDKAKEGYLFFASFSRLLQLQDARASCRCSVAFHYPLSSPLNLRNINSSVR